MRRPLLCLTLLLAGISGLGFGCKPHEQVSYTAPGGVAFVPPRPPETPYVPKRKGDSAPAKDVVALRQILTNLQRAQSYEAHIRTSAGNGNVVAELAFSRKNGLLGTLHAGDGLTSEVFVRDRSISVRYATGTWQDVSATDEGQNARKQLADALFVNPDGGTRLLLRDSAKVLETKDDPSGCKLYTLEQTFFKPDAFTQRLEICVQNTYPVRLKSTVPQGAVELTYGRFDDPSILATDPTAR